MSDKTFEPCPWCGAIDHRYYHLSEAYIKVTCNECEASGPYDITERLALKKWNRRTPPASLTEDQAWAEIRGTMEDNMLNREQKRTFVISILKGHLANPPAPPT